MTGALGIQAIVQALTGHHLRLVPVALALAAFHAILAVLGFDVTRWLLRVVLPVSLAFTVLLVGLFVASDDPRYAVGRVLDSPDQHLTWTGFATYVTVMCGASLTLVTSVADFCRYTPTRRDMRIGYAVSAIAAAAVTTFVGGYAGAASAQLNPFVAVAEVTSVHVLLAILLAAIVIQGIAANITNAYTAGLALANTIPRLGRVRATALAAAASVALSAFPDFVDQAQRWITHLGNLAAPLTGVILADYVVVKRTRTAVDALFDPAGCYRYLNGLNVNAIAAVGAGIAVYSAAPQAWVKVLVGVASGGIVYLLLHAAAAPLERLAVRPSSGRPSSWP